MKRKGLRRLLKFFGTVAIILPMFFIALTKAQASDVSNNVSSLTVSPTQINDGGKTPPFALSLMSMLKILKQATPLLLTGRIQEQSEEQVIRKPLSWRFRASMLVIW